MTSLLFPGEMGIFETVRMGLYGILVAITMKSDWWHHNTQRRKSRRPRPLDHHHLHCYRLSFPPPALKSIKIPRSIHNRAASSRPFSSFVRLGNGIAMRRFADGVSDVHSPELLCDNMDIVHWWRQSLNPRCQPLILPPETWSQPLTPHHTAWIIFSRL